jgi:prephenate dehydrogenase
VTGTSEPEGPRRRAGSAAPAAGRPGSAHAAPRSVVVIGTGLIGTSVALALRDRGASVWLADSDPTAARLAADLGAGAALPVGGPPGGPADLAVLATPPEAVAPALAAAQARGLARCYTDVASVKELPLARARELGCDLAGFTGGHPLSGRERSGPAAARADLFLGRPWVICPLPETAPGTVAVAASLARACGAQPVRMSAADHDRWVALVSHAPHVVAAAMAARLEHAPQGALALAGQGLRDVTRIAASDTGLWTQILAANAAHAGEVLEALAADLVAVAGALARIAGGDEEPVKDLAGLLERGGAGVARIPGKRGGPAPAYAIVQVVIGDRPGELARLFQAAGEAGINIEDVRIEHSPGLPAGVAEIAVRPQAAEQLIEALAGGGWPVRR